MKSRILFLITSIILAACGTTQPDRTIGGAGVGAVAGAAAGVITDMSVGQGILVGAAVGAVAGAVTDSGQVNLGEPPWKRDRHASNNGLPSANTVRAIQGHLQQHGLYAGEIDGIAGPQTERAIRAYQQQHGLLVDGRASYELAIHMEENS